MPSMGWPRWGRSCLSGEQNSKSKLSDNNAKMHTGFLKTLLRQNRTWKSAKVIKEAFLPTQRSEWINRAAKAWALACMGSGVWGEGSMPHGLSQHNGISYFYWGKWGKYWGSMLRLSVGRHVHAAVGWCVCKCTDRDWWFLKTSVKPKMGSFWELMHRSLSFF